MNPVRARVRAGRLTLDEPTDLPDGTEIELVAADSDELSEDERAVLNRAIDESLHRAKAGHVKPASVIIDEIHRRK